MSHSLGITQENCCLHRASCYLILLFIFALVRCPTPDSALGKTIEMGEEVASGAMGSENLHHHLSTPAEGGGSGSSKEEEERKGSPPALSQYLESIRAAGCWRELHRLAARLRGVVRVQFKIKGMDRQQALCLAHLSIGSAGKENSA